MTIQGDLTAEDWRHSRWEFIGSKFGEALWNTLFAIVFLAFLLYMHAEVTMFLIILSLPLIPFAFLLLEYVIVTRVQSQPSRRALARVNALPGPRTIEIDDHGLSITGPSIAKRINWNESYRKFQLGRDYLLVFESFNRYQIFPRRWFTEDQLAEFQTHLRQGLAKRPWFWIT
jgi:hypothetical protein